MTNHLDRRPSGGTIPATEVREIVRVEHVGKVFDGLSRSAVALDDVSLTIPAGTFTAVMGPSGSGKSTLLNCVAGLDTPTSGRIEVGGVEITGMKAKRLTLFRRERIGFVFQAYNLLPHLTVERNITLPVVLARGTVDRAWFDHVVDAVGIAELVGRLPHELSGGQQQRAAVARALITRPAVVMCDEPTGALDSRSGRQVLDLLGGTAADLGQTVVMVTHDPAAAAHAGTVVFLADGHLAGRIDGPTVPAINEHLTRLGEV